MRSASAIGETDLQQLSDESEGSPPQPFCGGCPVWRIARTLVWKNWIICRRNIGFLIFQFLLPALQVCRV